MHLYLITNTVNEKQYVGKTTKTVEKRWVIHKAHAKRNSPCALHRAIRKYGPEAFTIQRLPFEPQSEDGLNKWEMFTIEALRRVGTLYNMTDGGEAVSGLKMWTPERRAAQAQRALEQYRLGILKSPSDADRQKARAAKRGVKLSKEVRQKMSEAKKGKPWSEARRAAHQ